MKKSSKEINYLIEKIAEGDSNAFRLFYDCFYFKIYKYVSYFVKIKEIKEEIVSDVFFNFWQNRQNSLKIENVEAYLYTIARNTSFSYINNKDIETIDIEEYYSEELLSYNTPEENLIDEEMSVAIRKAIDNLPDRCRTIFLLAREEGLKYKEIAERLSISEKTVNAQMVLAIKKLTPIIGKLLIFILIIFRLATN
jgi:RNA polymerase sigma-70 factor (ECF subfamily)